MITPTHVVRVGEVDQVGVHRCTTPIWTTQSNVDISTPPKSPGVAKTWLSQSEKRVYFSLNVALQEGALHAFRISNNDAGRVAINLIKNTAEHKILFLQLLALHTTFLKRVYN